MNMAAADSLLLRILIGGACLVIIIAGMRAMADVLNIVFLAWLLAYAIQPLPNWMMRNRVPETPAVLGTLLIVIFGGITIAMVMSYSIVGLSQESLRFDGNSAPHHHFTCVKCGLIRDFSCAPMECPAMPEEAKAFGRPLSVHLEVKGLCAVCKKSAHRR